MKSKFKQPYGPHGSQSRRYDAYRSMRIPITLIDASSATSIKAALVSLAASQRNGPCHCVAQHINAIARQIGDGYTQAQAIANYTDVPAASATLTEITLGEG